MFSIFVPFAKNLNYKKILILKRWIRSARVRAKDLLGLK
jgi:hypothetical protein